jgi:hypothetical protein
LNYGEPCNDSETTSGNDGSGRSIASNSQGTSHYPTFELVLDLKPFLVLFSLLYFSVIDEAESAAASSNNK